MALRLAPLSNTERQSVISSLAVGTRLDGRGLLDNREVAVQFGRDYGCCTVSLGETRVLAQVSCEVVEPRPSRPNEGKIATSVHITPMAGPEYEAGRTNDAQDELQQLLESNIRESRCLDLEALCIMAEESVWQLRADVTVLNACGNLGDACNMAVVAALKHFHRPDVTVEEDGRVTIHSFSEREPIQTFLKKVPVCLTYAFCQQPDGGELIVFSDPTDVEERVVMGKLVVGLNPHGEITSMNFPGLVMLDKKHVTFCIMNAFQRARHCAELIDKLVEQDLEKRKTEVQPKGYVGKLISDQQMKRNIIAEKVTMMKTMSEQLQKVRQMLDFEANKNDGLMDVDENNAEYFDEDETNNVEDQLQNTNVNNEDDDGSSSSSDDSDSSSTGSTTTISSDSEFSDGEQRRLLKVSATTEDKSSDSKKALKENVECKLKNKSASGVAEKQTKVGVKKTKKQVAVACSAKAVSSDSEEDVKECVDIDAM